jgi:hypothetical protein
VVVLDVDEERTIERHSVVGLGSLPRGAASPIMITDPPISRSAWAMTPSGVATGAREEL